MACTTCCHSPVLLSSTNASKITRSSLSSFTLRACQSKLNVWRAGSQRVAIHRNSKLQLNFGAHKYSATKLSSISRRVNQTTTCSAVRGEEETTESAVQTTVPDESATQLMEVVAKRVQPYLKLARFHWSLTGPWLLSFWPFCWGATLAAESGTLPDWRIFTLLAVASVILHAAICTVNDLWDKDFDEKVERCKLRPLVTGEVTLFQGWAFFGAQTILYVAILSQLEVLSSSSQFQVLVAIQLILHILYPLAKRWTYWTPVVLGLPINWAVFLGWSAVRGSVALGPQALLPGLLFLGGCCWTVVMETIYAHQDIKHDRDAGVKSLPLLLGDSSKLWLTGFATAFVASLGIAGQIAALGWPFYIGIATTAIHLGWQIATVDLKNPNDCSAKFLTNRWVGAIVFGGIAGAKLLV